MEHPFINWTKSYDLYHDNNTFNFFVSSQKAGHFIAVIVYYIENKNRTDKSTQPAFQLKTEQFIDLTEEGVYKKCIDWIEENLKGEYKIEEDKSNRFIKWN